MSHNRVPLTSSERACRVAGMSMPSSRAVLRLITSSNVVGCVSPGAEEGGGLAGEPTRQADRSRYSRSLTPLFANELLGGAG